MNGTGNSGNIGAKTVPQKKGWVYFIGCGDAIKIGFASVVTDRLKSLQTGSHKTLVLLAQKKGTRHLEKTYHKRFAKDHIRGEWFRNSSSIRSWINQINGVRRQRRPRVEALPADMPPQPQPDFDIHDPKWGKLRGQLKERRKGETNPAIYHRIDIIVQQIDNRFVPGISAYMQRTMRELAALSH